MINMYTSSRWTLVNSIYLILTYHDIWCKNDSNTIFNQYSRTGWTDPWFKVIKRTEGVISWFRLLSLLLYRHENMYLQLCQKNNEYYHNLCSAGAVQQGDRAESRRKSLTTLSLHIWGPRWILVHNSNSSFLTFSSKKQTYKKSLAAIWNSCTKI